MATDVTSESVEITDGLPQPRRRWAMVAVITAVGMASLDSSIANIALPIIAADLHISPATAIWVVNTYQIAMVATLLPFAALGEIVGHERLYFGGLVLFVLGAIGCTMAESLPTLLTARLFQGVGGSAMMSVNSALVRFIYPKRLLGRGIGLNAFVVATSITIGPTLASGILSIGHWPLLFAVHVPIGITAMLIARRTLPPTPRATHRFDIPGAIMTGSALGLFIFGLGNAARNVPPAIVALEIAAAVLLGYLLLRRQAGHPAPMLPVDLFKIPVFSLSVATAICSFATQGLAFVSLPFFFQTNLGRTAVETGLLMTPWPVVVAVMAPIAGRLSDHYPAGVLGSIGLVMLGIGMALLATLPPDPDALAIGWRMAVCGCGFGFFQAPNMKALMSSPPPGRAGGASGMVATARLTGQTIGATLAALCFSIAGAGGPKLALTLGIGFAAVGSLASVMRLVMARPRPT